MALSKLSNNQTFHRRVSTYAPVPCRQVPPHNRRQSYRHVTHAARWEKEKQDALLADGECPVPYEQQPVFELKNLQEAFLFDWATEPVPNFLQHLAGVYLGFFMFLGLPVSAVTFDLSHETLQCLVAASAGSMFIVTILVMRLYLGWAHVGNRLLSATVEYEETGWYDGQVWVKTPQILMRDRLLSAYTVKPAIERLKRTLLGLGGALATSMLVLALVPPPQAISANTDGYLGASAMAAGPREVSTYLAHVQDDDQMDTYWKNVESYEAMGSDTQRPGAGSLMMLSHMRPQ